jgi:small-conductance mechanosensitive channel
MVGTVAAAFLTEWIFSRLLRALVGRTKSTLDDQVVGILHRPVRVSVLLAGVLLGLSLVEWGAKAEGLVTSGVQSAVTLVWCVATMRLCSAVLRSKGSAGGAQSLVQSSTVPLFDTLTRVGIIVLGAYFFLLAWNVDLTAWIASAGIAGIAIGFAAKDTLANFFGGMAVLVDAPYRIGDMILLDSGERGRVTEVGIRSTRILTRDDFEIIIPNASIATAKIVNESRGRHSKRRVRVAVGVSYDSDVEVVRRILSEVAANEDDVCGTPAPRVRFLNFGESSLDFELHMWVRDPEFTGRALDAVNTAILARFREAGIEIPFPQRVVHPQSSPPAPDSDQGNG